MRSWRWYIDPIKYRSVLVQTKSGALTLKCHLIAV